jgi:predicted ArsR family transcriptional regulator
VSVDKVKACVPSGPFTAKALEEASGATGATARKAIAELVAVGAVQSLGRDPDYSGRGRAPTLYKSV